MPGGLQHLRPRLVDGCFGPGGVILDIAPVDPVGLPLRPNRHHDPLVGHEDRDAIDRGSRDRDGENRRVQCPFVDHAIRSGAEHEVFTPGIEGDVRRGNGRRGQRARRSIGPCAVKPSPIADADRCIGPACSIAYRGDVREGVRRVEAVDFRVGGDPTKRVVVVVLPGDDRPRDARHGAFGAQSPSPPGLQDAVDPADEVAVPVASR